MVCAHCRREYRNLAAQEKIGRLIADSSEWKRLRSIAMERIVQNRKTFHGAISKLMQFAVCTSNVFLHVLPYFCSFGLGKLATTDQTIETAA